MTYQTYVDAPEFLNGIKGNNFLQEVVPVITFSRRWLREPKTPFVHKRMLDIEIVDIVEDGLDLIGSRSRVLVVGWHRLWCDYFSHGG